MRWMGWLGVLGMGVSVALSQGAAGTGAEERFDAETPDVLAGVLAGKSGPRGGEECLAGSICGQDAGACQPANVQWYFYSDLEFCTPPACQRVRCENFPPPGVTINKAIGVITWQGVYIDDSSNGCTKGVHNFRIRFYQDSGGAPANPLTGVYTENLVATAVDTGTTVNFATVPATLWQFTAVLTTPQALTTGWFSIAGYGEPGCYHLWQGSPEGDNKFYQWYEVNGTVPGAAVTTNCDLAYCFGEKKVGACCDDCSNMCENNVAELLCLASNGRFLLNGTCPALNPVCGEGLGACCQDDGTCAVTRCRKDAQHPNGCIGYVPPEARCLGDLNCDGNVDFADLNAWVMYCGTLEQIPDCPMNADMDCDGVPCDDWGDFELFQQCISNQGLCGACGWCMANPCYGDLNGDRVIGFADINPFVLYLANFEAWRVQHPYVDELNGDINGDQMYPSFGDINPFVALLGQGERACSSGARWQGAVWLGAGTTCDDCCTVVVPPGANLENEPEDCWNSSVFNGGCDNLPDHPPQFSAIGALPYTVYGESWAGDGMRDTDWYEIALAEPAQIVWTVNAEFAPQAFIVAAGYCDPNDPNACKLGEASGEPCVDVVAIATLAPGTYWLVVAPAAGKPAQCQADYRATLTAMPMELCQVTCPTDPAPFHEAETCAENLNPGCNGTPPVFETIPIAGGGVYGVCGTLYACRGVRDTDWYRLTLNTDKSVTFRNVQSEVPIWLTPIVNSTGTEPSNNCDDYYIYPAMHWTQCEDPVGNEVTFDFAAGTYWLLVAPSTYDGTNVNGLFDGFPCAGPFQDYYFEIVVPECLTPCADLGGGNPEGEGNCVFPDTYNAGCDGSPVNKWTALPLNTAVCGTTGTNAGQKDCDWYKFTLTSANSRVRSMYLYSNAAMTFEIWPSMPGDPNTPNCAAGWLEGLDVPQCYVADDLAFIKCYPAGTYYLRVYPTNEAACGTEYYLALLNVGTCTPCNYTIPGDCATTQDDPCDDVNDFDTNAGCNIDSVNPPAMNFEAADIYCGRVYAGLVNGTHNYYDPDWFTVRPTAGKTQVMLSIQADFAYAVELYADCAAYNNGTPLGSKRSTTGSPPFEAACVAKTLVVQGLMPNTTYLGVIYPIDHLGEIAKYYFPCAGDYVYRIEVSYP